MTLPALAGSALKATSWASPMVSKAMPITARAAPAKASGPSGPGAWPSWTGRATTNCMTYCREKTSSSEVLAKLQPRSFSAWASMAT